MAIALAVLIAVPGAGLAPASAEGESSVSFWKKKKKNPQGVADQSSGAPSWKGSQANGKATTETEIVANDTRGPMLSVEGVANLQAALSKYQEIAAQGGWPKVSGTKLKKGAQGKTVTALNKRLYIEGYVRAEATEGEFAAIFTSATEDGLRRFQRNHGLAVTGVADTATVNELNVPAERRLAAIRANLPRMQEYSRDLGGRYVVVNVPAQQIEAVSNGRVYSRHNAIVGRPSRPTPVVMTSLADIKFNPYWNAPPSIIERDIIPKMLSGGSSKVLQDMRIKVFDGVGGPEVDPDTINWRRAIPDNYHFRQEPGGENAMASAKIEFPSPFGIYLHDTPERNLFASGSRFYSSGCVRVDKVAILLNWILNGQDGITSGRITQLAQSEERLDVALASPPQLRVAYLTAWANPRGETSFRPDVYELDGTGFVVGQPLPVGETSGGQRYVLKPVARQLAAVDADEADGFFWFGSRTRKTIVTNSRKSIETLSRKSVAAASRTTSAAAKKVTSGVAGLSRLLRNPNRGDVSGTTWTDGIFSAKKNPVKKVSKKVDDGKKKKKIAAKKIAPAKVDETAPITKKAVKKDQQTVAAKKVEPVKKSATAKKPDDKCKLDKAGKPLKDCKPVAAVKPKPEKTAAAAN